jgi:4'-phosphopantetheinyl transferase
VKVTDPHTISTESTWRTAPEQFPLHSDEVHVWRADLDVGADVLQRLQGTLSADEQARAERFYFPVDRARYLAGRGILRALLARYLGNPACDLRFCYGARGKPALAPGNATEDLRFNLSHSQGLALFAFALRREVGIDLEYVRPSLTNDRLAERFFSPQEVTALRALPESVQTEAFFHCWTRKEAYIKARGGGLGIALASFAVSLAPGQMTNLLITSDDTLEAGRRSLRALAPGGGCVAAIAAEGKDWSLALWQWV